MWDEQRDARTYSGPHAVVAHPPCTRWCRLAALVESRHGYKRGEDGGCFKAALGSVRQFGGVLEHPAFSEAWPSFGLMRPPSSGGWVWADWVGGWTCHIEQVRYGHAAKKATWLYLFGHPSPPQLRWGSTPDSVPSVTVSWCRNRSTDTRRRLSKREASATPHEFRDLLLKLARETRLTFGGV